MILSEDVYIEHFGVRGMRWGVRKGRSSTGSKAPPKKLNRKEKRSAKKAANKAADEKYEKDVANLINQVVKNQNLVGIRTKNRLEIMTGQEAAQRIIRTGRIPRDAIWYEYEAGGG